MKQLRKGYGFPACTKDLSKGGKEKCLGFVGNVNWRNCGVLVLCRSSDVWTVPYAQRQRVMAAIRVAKYLYRQVNRHHYSLALLLCVWRRGYLWRKRWKRHPSIIYRIDRTIPLPLLCHQSLPLRHFLCCVLGHLHTPEWSWRSRGNRWVIPLGKLIWGTGGEEGWVQGRRMRRICDLGSLFCRWALRWVQLRWVCAFTSNYFKVCPEDAIVRLYWIRNTHCDSIWCFCRPKLQFRDLAACSCSVKQRKSHRKKKGRGVNMLLSKIQT